MTLFFLFLVAHVFASVNVNSGWHFVSCRRRVGSFRAVKIGKVFNPLIHLVGYFC